MRISDCGADVCSAALVLRVETRIGNRGLIDAAAVFQCELLHEALEGLRHRLAVFGDRRAPARHVRIGIRLQHDRFAEIDVRLAIRLAENLAGLEQAFGRFLALRSEEQTSELQSLMRISYAVFCLKNNNYRY